MKINTVYRISVKRRGQLGWLMWLLVVLPFFLAFLQDLLHLPDLVRYILDVAWFGLFLFQLRNRRQPIRALRPLILWVVLFLVYTAMVYVVQYQSILYYLWGVRNNFRFYAAFFAFAAFLTQEDAKAYLKLFDTLFWVNFAVSLVQYFFLGFSWDHLGGLFGVESGCNAYSTLFFTIVVAKSVLSYLEGEEKAWPCLLKCGASLYLSALAEVKFFYVAFVLVLGLALVFTAFSWKKLLLILGGSLGLALATTLVGQMFDHGQDWFNLEYLLEIVTSDKGYTSSGDLNRFTAMGQINELWLEGPGQRLVGLGLGNCDFAGFDFLVTPFYEANGHMHYTWMSHAFLYLETGNLGLLFYGGFFVLVFFKAWKMEKQSRGFAVTCCRLARILAVCCPLIAVYNSSLRMESGYMVYFVLALPFVVARGERKNEQMQTVAA